MTETTLASADDCRPLYELIGKVRDLAPWDWMEEDDLFGVQDPDTGEYGFVSIMGMAGEHFAVAVYQGERGLFGFLRMQQEGPDMSIEDLLSVPQLQASLEDREVLEAHDRDQIKTLSLKYRGRNAWPMFRCYRPGFLPWFIESAEARFLAYALEQVLEVAPRVRENPDILVPAGDYDFLVRVAEKDGRKLSWRDEVIPFNSPPPLDLNIHVELELIEAVRQLPKSRQRVEMDFFMMPSPIAARGERPYFPYSLMMVDATRGMPLNTELLTPVPSLEQMWSGLGIVTLRMIHQTGFIPAELHVRDELLYGILSMLAANTGLKVKKVNELRFLDEMVGSLMDFMGGF